MSYLHKSKTALRLLARLDWATLHDRWHHHRAERRIARFGGASFVHQELGFAAVCHPDWPESYDQYCRIGGHARTDGDAWEYTLVRRWLQPGDSAIDAGTNLGLYSFAMADRIGPTGEVLAVDADPTVVEHLDRATRLLGTAVIRSLHGAVSDRSGTLTFFLRTDRSVTADQSLIPDAALRTACTPVEVQAHRFPDLLARLARPDRLALVKMDIEGAEALALSSVPPALLAPAGPLWLVEINPGVLARFGSSPEEVLRFFPDTAFERWIVPKHPLGPVTQGIRHYRADDPLRDSLYYNLIAVPRGGPWESRRASLAANRPTS